MKSLFFLLFASPFLLAAASDSSRVEYLDTIDAIGKDYCRSDIEDKVFGGCGGQANRMADVYFTQNAGDLVSKHVNEALTRGYFRALSKYDLFHGHFILRGPQVDFDSPEEYFSAVGANLYHSEEYTPRWSEEGDAGIPIEKRSPRSYVGWPDGHIDAARDILKPGVDLGKSYINAGTISQREIVESVPSLSVLSYGTSVSQEKPPKTTLKLCRGTACTRCETDEGYFLIVPEPQGRFHLPDNTAYEIYFRCTFDDRAT